RPWCCPCRLLSRDSTSPTPRPMDPCGVSRWGGYWRRSFERQRHASPPSSRIWRIEMDVTLDSLMNEVLLAEVGEGLDSLAGRLEGLHDGWLRMGVDPVSVAYLGAMIEEMG